MNKIYVQGFMCQSIFRVPRMIKILCVQQIFVYFCVILLTRFSRVNIYFVYLLRLSFFVSTNLPCHINFSVHLCHSVYKTFTCYTSFRILRINTLLRVTQFSVSHKVQPISGLIPLSTV